MSCAGVFLAAISCQLPLNGLQMVRKRLLGTDREPISSALWGRIYNRMSVYAYSDWAWLLPPHQRNQLRVGTGLWWKEWQREKDVYIYVGLFIQWGVQLPASKGVRPLRRCCGLEVRYHDKVLDVPSSMEV